MPDQQTLRVYDDAAPAFAKEWGEQPLPADLYRLLSEYFEPGLTADIGCGSGRDLAWLASQGFSVRGFDVSEGLLVEARKRYPEVVGNPHRDARTIAGGERSAANKS